MAVDWTTHRRRAQPPGAAALLLAALAFAIHLETNAGGGAWASTIFEDYVECRDHEMFGNLSLICDAEHKLQRTTLRNLDSLLRDLQTKIPCECANGCARGEGRSDKYMGLLVVTTTAKIGASASGNNATAAENASATLNATARRIYDDARLGDDTCDNGLLILYIKDQQKLATYRGRGRFALLNDDDMKRLYQLARKSAQTRDGSTSDGDGVALQYLLSNYDDRQRRADGTGGVLRAETWAPIVGLTLALLVVLLILAALFAFLLARLCCCCCGRNSERKDKYYVSAHAPTNATAYKTIEPIYIVTPPVSEHGGYRLHHGPHHTVHYGSHPGSQRHSLYLGQQPPSPTSLAHAGVGDYSIYSSPYGVAASPPPPPHLYGPPMDGGGPIVTHPARSRSITPTSMHRTRIHPQRSASSTRDSQIVRSPEQSAHSSKRERVKRRSVLAGSSGSGGAYYVPAGYSASHYPADSPASAATAAAGDWSHQRPASGQTAHGAAGDDATSDSGGERLPPLPFLDPNRKREVQTKREYIT